MRRRDIDCSSDSSSSAVCCHKTSDAGEAVPEVTSDDLAGWNNTDSLGATTPTWYTPVKYFTSADEGHVSQEDSPWRTNAKLFINGRSQAVRIPKAYQFQGVSEVLIRKEGDTLIIVPARKTWGVLRGRSTCRR